MDAVAQNTGRRVGEPLTERSDAGTGHTAASQGRDGTLRGDAPAWRAAGVGAAFGLAAVVWSLQDHLAEWSAIGGAAAFMALGLLSMTGLRFVVDQEKARRTVFYAGERQGAWFLLNFLGIFQIPRFLISGIADPTGLVLAAAGLGIVVAVANQALVSRYMTGRRQPDPEPVPLG